MVIYAIDKFGTVHHSTWHRGATVADTTCGIRNEVFSMVEYARKPIGALGLRRKYIERAFKDCPHCACNSLS